MLGLNPIAASPLGAGGGFQGYGLSVDTGSFTITGQDIPKTLSVLTPTGSFVISGQDFTFNKSLHLRGVNGSFFVRGNEVTVRGWLEPVIDAEVWSEQAFDSEIWAEISVSGEAWAEQDVAGETWNEQSVSSETWTEQS